MTAHAPANVQIVSKDIAIADLLNEVNVPVTTHSTIADDAVCAQIPLVFVALHHDLHQLRYVEHGAAQQATTVAELTTTRDELLFDETARTESANRQAACEPSNLALAGDASAGALARLLTV